MRILSIDGGGIRGIIPAIALSALENVSGKRVQDLFDLIVGTSTGGILALALARGKRPMQILDLYNGRGAEIFARPWWWLGITGPKYSAAGVEKVLREELGDGLLSAALRPVAVTAFSLARRDPVVIASWDPSYNMPLWAAARATSAAPSYFPEFGVERFVDGGIWANNPARVACEMARRRYPGDAFKLLSLGTGQQANATRKDTAGWGLIGWAGPAVNLLMDAPMKDVERSCEAQLGERYARVQVPLLGGHWPMDDTSHDYLSRLIDAGQSAAGEIEQLFRTGWFAQGDNQ